MLPVPTAASSGSLIDKIGSVLQLRAQCSDSPPDPSTSMTPEESSSSYQQPLSALSLALSSSFAQISPGPCQASPIFGKRPASPIPSQSKRARLTPEIGSSSSEGSLPPISSSSLPFPSPCPTEIRDETVFCTVPGRLAILNNNSKYPVTISEIKRRLGNPERLNASIMGGVLRRAKAKNGGKELREHLEQMGLELPIGKRKALDMTLFTCMVEGEAVQLARDFSTLCESEFPVDSLADHLLRKKEEEDKDKQKQKMEAAREVLSGLREILLSDRPPLMELNPSPILDTPLQNSLTHFSMCTHGFGSPAVVAALNVIIKFTESCLDRLAGGDTLSSVPLPLPKVTAKKEPTSTPSESRPTGIPHQNDVTNSSSHGVSFEWQQLMGMAALFQSMQQQQQQKQQ